MIRKKTSEVAESSVVSEGKAGKPARSRAEKSAKYSRAKRFVFIIGDDGGILIFMHGQKVMRRLFAPSPQLSHTEAMLEIIRANPQVPVFVLADVMDQQYVPQTFPPVHAMSVVGLVKRRLLREFQPDDLKSSLPLGRDKKGRREWRYLLIALPKTPLIAEWLDLLVNLPNEFKGIYLLPVEAVNYIAALNKQSGNAAPKAWQMLITHNKVSGFRQVVVHDGKLVFTRVSQAIDDAIPAVIAGNVEQEIISTIEYLKRLEFRDEADLDVTVVVSQDVADSLDLKRFGFSHSNVFSPLAVAETLGLEQAALSADRYGDVVTAAAFAINKKRVLRFSTAYMDKLTKLYQAKFALKVVAGLIVAGCALSMLMSTYSMFQNYGKISDAEQEQAKLMPDLEKSRKGVSGLKVDIKYMSAVVSAADAYLKNAQLPEDVAKSLSKVNGVQARIKSYNWAYTDPNGNKGNQATSELPVVVKIEIDMANAGNDPDMLTKAAENLKQSIKSELPEYEVTSEPYKWVQEKTDSLSLEMNTVIPPENKIVNFTLRGPKKGKA